MDKINFQNLPSTTTPLSAQNLNQLQTNVENGIKDAGVVVSATEPSTDRKKVWKQHSENLFDKDARITGYGVAVNNGILTETSTWTASNYIKVTKNKTYCINNASVGNSTSYGICYFDRNYKFISGTSWTNLGYSSINQYSNINFTVPNNNDIEYAIVDIRTSNTNFDTLQIETGNVFSSYENFVVDTEYILNNNNIYEEFISHDDSKIDILKPETTITGEYKGSILIDNSDGTILAFTPPLNVIIPDTVSGEQPRLTLTITTLYIYTSSGRTLRTNNVQSATVYRLQPNSNLRFRITMNTSMGTGFSSIAGSVNYTLTYN